MFAALAVLTGWRGPEAKQLLSSIPVSANQPSYSHTLHSHVLLTRLDLYPLSCWGLQPQLSSSKRPESHQEPDEPDFTFPVDIIFFIIFINFSLLLFSDYIRAVRILKGNLVGETWFPGKYHTWKSNKHHACYCGTCSWNLQEVLPYPLCGKTEKIVFSLVWGKI